MKITPDMQEDLDRIREYAFENDWDSYGATAMSEQDFQFMLDTIDQFPENVFGNAMHITPYSIEIHADPAYMWITIDSFGRKGYGCLRTIETNGANEKIRENDADAVSMEYIHEGFQWLNDVTDYTAEKVNNFLEEFGGWGTNADPMFGIEHIDFIYDVGSFKPFQFFITMPESFKGLSTGFVWQNFRASNGFLGRKMLPNTTEDDPEGWTIHDRRVWDYAFFHNTQIINTRVLKELTH